MKGLPPPAITRTCQDSRKVYFESEGEVARRLYMDDGGPSYRSGHPGRRGWVDPQKDFVVILDEFDPQMDSCLKFCGNIAAHLQSITISKVFEGFTVFWREEQERAWVDRLADNMPALRTVNFIMQGEEGENFFTLKGNSENKAITNLFGNDSFRTIDLLDPFEVDKVILALKTEEATKSCAARFEANYSHEQMHIFNWNTMKFSIQAKWLDWIARSSNNHNLPGNPKLKNAVIGRLLERIRSDLIRDPFAYCLLYNREQLKKMADRIYKKNKKFAVSRWGFSPQEYDEFEEEAEDDVVLDASIDAIIDRIPKLGLLFVLLAEY